MPEWDCWSGGLSHRRFVASPAKRPRNPCSKLRAILASWQVRPAEKAPGKIHVHVRDLTRAIGNRRRRQDASQGRAKARSGPPLRLMWQTRARAASRRSDHAEKRQDAKPSGQARYVITRALPAKAEGVLRRPGLPSARLPIALRAALAAPTARAATDPEPLTVLCCRLRRYAPNHHVRPGLRLNLGRRHVDRHGLASSQHAGITLHSFPMISLVQLSLLPHGTHETWSTPYLHPVTSETKIPSCYEISSRMPGSCINKPGPSNDQEFLPGHDAGDSPELATWQCSMRPVSNEDICEHCMPLISQSCKRGA